MELLYIAQHLRIPIAEVAVNWTEIEGKEALSFLLRFLKYQSRIK